MSETIVKNFQVPRNICIRDCIKPKGLYKHLLKSMQVVSEPGFAKIRRDTEYIELDRVYAWIEGKKYPYIEWKLAELKSAGIKLDKPQTYDELLELVLIYYMFSVVKRIDRRVQEIAWSGNSANICGDFYKEFDGLDRQLADSKKVAFDKSVDIIDLFNKCKQQSEHDWRIVCRPVVAHEIGQLHNFNNSTLVQDSQIAEVRIGESAFSSNIYIVPLSKQLDDGGVCAKVVEPEFSWEMLTLNWDCKLTGQCELLMSVSRPELALVITDVEIDYSKYMRDIEKGVWL